jgi:nucleoside-triphosphatase
MRVGGFISPEERHHGTRTAFHVVDISSGRMAILASVKGDGPKVSKYHVDIRSFESVAIPAVEGFGKCDVVVIDEIGRMELKSRRFAALLDDLLESDTPLIASLHRDLVDRYGSTGEVIQLTDDNRQAMFQLLLRRAKISLLEEKRKPAEKKEAKAKKGKKEAPKPKMPPKAKAGKRPREKRGRRAEERPKEEMKKEEPEEAEREEKPRAEERGERKRKGFFDRLKSIFGGE